MTGSEHLRHIAELARGIAGNGPAQWFHKVGDLIDYYGGVPNPEDLMEVPKRGICPECEGNMEIETRLCKNSRDYLAGYRAIWKCLECGEMELR